jgi:hypothetical protein
LTPDSIEGEYINISHCRFNYAISDTNVVNQITTPYNVVDSHIYS